MKRVKEEGRRKIERKDARWEAKEETKIGRKEKVGVDGEREKVRKVEMIKQRERC